MRDWRLVLFDMEREEERKRSMVKLFQENCEIKNVRAVAAEKLKIASAICSRGRKMSDEIMAHALKCAGVHTWRYENA